MEHSPNPTMTATDRRVVDAYDAPAPRQPLLYLVILACAIVFVVFLPALSARATFLDDSMYLSENPLVRNPGWTSTRRFFGEVLHPSSVTGYYQPLTMVSLMADYALVRPGDGLRPFHQTSLLLHLGNTALMIVLLYLLFGESWIATAVGLLFGLHPLCVDSVCWLSERKTVLASFFALWSLIFYVAFVRTPRRRYYVACLFAYLLALLSKPITVPLPLAMLLLDFWPLSRLGRRSVVEKLPLFVISGAFAAITYISQSRTAPIFLPGDYNPLYAPLILCHNIVFYLWKLVWPVGVSPHYALPQPFGPLHPAILSGIVGTCILMGVLAISLRWTRMFLAGWLVFFAILLPAMGIVSVTPIIVANRYAYLPSFGLWLVVAGILVRVCGRARRRYAVGGIAAATVVLVAGGGETLAARKYLCHWSDTLDLYEYALTIAPNEPVLHNGAGLALATQGETEEAVAHYREAIRISPDFALAHFNLAAILSESDSTTHEAILHYATVLRLEPANQRAHLNLGRVLCLKGDLDGAIAEFRRIVQSAPGNVMGHYNLGKTLLIAGQDEEGIAHFRRAIALAPTYLPAMKDLAWFLATHPSAEVRDPNEAIRLAERAMAMTQRRDAGVLDTLAAAYALDGQYKKAAETAQEALEIAKRLRNYELVDQIQERLRLYQFECPYYENPKVQLERLMAKKKAGNDGSEVEGAATENGQPAADKSYQEVQDETETMAAK